MFVVILDALLLVLNIVFIVLIARAEAENKGIKTAGLVISIVSIIYSLLQQFLTLILGGLILSLADGNQPTSEADTIFISLLLIPVVIVIAAIILLVKSVKKKK